MEGFGLLWALAIWLLCAVWSGMAAHSKGRRAADWVLAGFFFGPFALLALAAMGRPPERTLPCGACRMPVSREATRCGHCTSMIELKKV